MTTWLPRRLARREGNTLVTVLVGMALALIMLASFTYLGSTCVQWVQRWDMGDQMLLCAQSAIEQAKVNINSNFTAFSSTAANYMIAFTWFNTWSSTSLGQPYVYNAPQSATFSNATITITIVSVANTGWMQRDVVLNCRATNPMTGGVNRGVQETIRYQMTRSPIFNFAYFR